jgi:hypothetical protein
MKWYLWVLASAGALWSLRHTFKGRCWSRLSDFADAVTGASSPGGGHARTKLIRTDYAQRCTWCGGAYNREPDKSSLYPIPIVRLWECRCGELWSEGGNENAKEYAERMADLTIAEDEKKGGTA